MNLQSLILRSDRDCSRPWAGRLHKQALVEPLTMMNLIGIIHLLFW